MNNSENSQNTRTINKGLIFIKSTVLALFIILVALVIFFMITKNKKEQAKEKVVRDCVATKEIMVDNEIMKVETEGRVINVLTKMDKNGKSQELIRIDSVCGNEIGRIKFVIKNE